MKIETTKRPYGKQRDIQLRVRLSEKELNTLATKAAKANMTKSEYVRSKVV